MNIKSKERPAADSSAHNQTTDAQSSAPETTERTRARSMTPEERREMIIDAAIPFFLDNGPNFTSKQLAEHLGLAEGTIFRAFGDKDSLKYAVITEFFERGPKHLAEGAIDPNLPLEEKVSKVVEGARERISQVFKMFSHLTPEEVKHFRKRPKGAALQKALTIAFANNQDQLTVPLEHLGSIMQIAGIAAHASHFDESAAIEHDELVNFILYGIAGHPAERTDLAR